MTIHFDRMTEPEIANYVTCLIDDYAKDVAQLSTSDGVGARGIDSIDSGPLPG